MVDRIQLRDVRESFFQSFLDRPNNWESLFLAYRFCGRGEGLLRHYWPKADKLFLEQLMRVLPLLDRATEFVRVPSVIFVRRIDIFDGGSGSRRLLRRGALYGS